VTQVEEANSERTRHKRMSGVCRDETGDEMLKHRPAISKQGGKGHADKGGGRRARGKRFPPIKDFADTSLLCFVNNNSIEIVPLAMNIVSCLRDITSPVKARKLQSATMWTPASPLLVISPCHHH
jgi:hypothetical protein